MKYSSVILPSKQIPKRQASKEFVEERQRASVPPPGLRQWGGKRASSDAYHNDNVVSVDHTEQDFVHGRLED